ncbi:MAG: exodeoxyribonuclease V subunit gamma [Oscillospiraceae bacterium]|nr:exodeoxyribonuclease V subunit gamma [Oscillospiraceae bacterium]
MSVKIVTGSIGSGKTEYCIDEIRRVHEVYPSKKCVMLVPSHYSHETEKLLINTFGGTGLNNIEVTSFEKLARELLTGTEKRLSAPGKQAVICRAIKLALDALDENKFDSRLLLAVKRSGFIDVAQSLISELHRYLITGPELRQQAEQMENGALKQKLEITALISDNYDELLSAADYIDSDEDLIRLSKVAGNRFKDNTVIWIDKFDEFLPQQLKVVMSLIDSGADITITFSTCEDEADTYYGTTAAINHILSYANAEIIHLSGSMKHIKNAPDLHFLFSTWFDRTGYLGEVHNAEVFEARDAYMEIEHTACRILDFVREDKYRFRDIAVICGNQDSYSHIIEAIFDEYDIPYYSDEQLSIVNHPIAMQILSLFDIIENNWDYSSMFGYLRSGFIYYKKKSGYRRISSDDIDKLENYVLKKGIRGKSMWQRSWTGGHRRPLDEALQTESRQDTEAEELESLRKLITEPIEAYCDSVKTAASVTDYCCALYEFLESINLYQGLKAELLGMAMNRAAADAQRFGQIWNLILDVLNQVNTALGSYNVTASEFADYMRAAMAQCTIRTIPSGVDRVFIGSVEKNRSENSKIIFAVGAISGTFPSDSGTEGFFSNSDREILSGLDIQLAPTTIKKSEKQYNNVYKTLSAVTEKLCVSYPVQTPDGNACRRSQTVIDICAKLHKIKHFNDIVKNPEEERQLYISSPSATLHKMLIHPRYNPLWKHVNEWFDEHDEWRHKLFTIKSTRRNFNERVISINPDLAVELYPGRIFYSPTHLNTYAECPFKNFMQYGLGIKTREEYTLNAADTGSYAHELVRRFCEEVDSGYDWKTVTDEECEKIVDDIVAGTTANVMNSDYSDKERTADIFRRMGHTVKEVAKTVRKSIRAGSFKPYAYELKVKEELTPDIGITGTIDRLDICSHDSINEYRIIDYKTGSKSFSVADISEGLDMQPVIYALVMREHDNNARISGMYYSKMRSDYANIKSTSRLETAQNHLKQNTMLDGATFVEADLDGNILSNAADRIETELARSDGSMFFGKNGPGKTGGNIRSLAAGGRLMDTVHDKVIDIDREIRAGNIDISPLEHPASNKSICSYCDYSTICKFDEKCKTTRFVTKKDKDVWDILEDKKEGDN